MTSLMATPTPASDQENIEPAPNSKRRRLSLKLKKKAEPSERFPLVSKDQVESIKRPTVPKNTSKSTQWAVRCFETWRRQRNERTEEKCPEDVLLGENHEQLCHWLCVCVNELRKENGEPYTPRSLAMFIAGLQRYVSEQKDVAIRLCNPDNPVFKPLHRTLENRYRELHAEGVGTSRKRAEVVTSDEEERLWASGVLSNDTPDGLLAAVFYYNGVNFVLRGGEEHRSLKLSQLEFREVPDPDNPNEMISCVEYTEHGSKNRPGGRQQLNLDNKCITQYACPQLGERCHVYLLKLYVSKLPEKAFERDVFYMKPVANLPVSPSDPWYCNSPLGHNTLSKFLKVILGDAGIDTAKKSNHSLRATGISHMFKANVPDKLIMERSGHLSRDGIASYERTTPEQQKAVCSTLTSALSVPPLIPKSAFSPFTLEGKQEDDTLCGVQEEKKEQEDVDLMKKLQFSNMTSCTFNITFK